MKYHTQKKTPSIENYRRRKRLQKSEQLILGCPLQDLESNIKLDTLINRCSSRRRTRKNILVVRDNFFSRSVEPWRWRSESSQRILRILHFRPEQFGTLAPWAFKRRQRWGIRARGLGEKRKNRFEKQNERQKRRKTHFRNALHRNSSTSVPVQTNRSISP